MRDSFGGKLQICAGLFPCQLHTQHGTKLPRKGIAVLKCRKVMLDVSEPIGYYSSVLGSDCCHFFAFALGRLIRVDEGDRTFTIAMRDSRLNENTLAVDPRRPP